MAAISNTLIDTGRKMGRQFGYEMAVEVSENAIETTMEDPNGDERAWDPSMFKHGNLFIAGHANPVKPVVDYRKDLEDPNQAELEESDKADTDGDGKHYDLISSPRYREYMRQDLISQLLNPREQWKTLLLAMLALGVISLATLASSLSAAGVL